MTTKLKTWCHKLGMISVITTLVLSVYYAYDLSDKKTHVWFPNVNNHHTNNSIFDGIPLPSSFASHYRIKENVPLNVDALNSLYSSYQCVGPNPGDLGTGNNWPDRQCILRNVCLHRNRSSLTYIADFFYPSSVESLGSTMIRSHQKFVSLRHGFYNGAESVIQVRLIPMNYLNPVDTNSNLTYLSGTYLIYQILPDEDMNFGHIIFDDAFGLYANLKQFGATRHNSPAENHVLVFRSCSEFRGHLTDLCIKFTEGIFPTITSYPVRSIDSLFKLSVNSNRICFRQLVVGHGISGAVGWGPRNSNRAQIFSEFRSDLLRVHGIDPNVNPKKHHILLVNKNGRRKFKNLHDIYKQMLSTPQYTGIKITIADDFKNLTIPEQLKLFQTITIAISPCGGVSMLFFFLPRQSVLIVSGNIHAGRMESQLWDYQSHLRVIHYPIESSSDYELPPGYKKDDWVALRNHADTVLKAEKLFPLIDRALVTSAMKTNVHFKTEES